MKDALICDGIRTPFGRYGGALSNVRADDLAAVPIKGLIDRNPDIDWNALDEVYFGCANQAGEDNRNVARMASLLSGLPADIPGCTINRLCGSSMDATGIAARGIKTGEINLAISGGVESMTRAPFVMAKSNKAFTRGVNIEDTTIGWRFVNSKMLEMYGTDSMAQTAENLAKEFKIDREDQDNFALRSQQRYEAAKNDNFFKKEIIEVKSIFKGETLIFDQDEHPRSTNLEKLSQLTPVVNHAGSVTAGNASGVNDGATALLLASESAAKRYKLTPRARILNMATAGVAPRIMGIGPIPATKKVLELTGLKLEQMDVIELNEAFAAQALAVIRNLELPDDLETVNPNGGAIAIGHPLGASGARLILTALRHLEKTGGRYALCTMCVGVGQGIAVIIERIK